ncbi:MAG TPA: ABC transporter ATP-binding protein, partial [Demequina sp.]|nr:ABC transporter ATP-binding protein [Demequina sp.]
MSHPPTGPRRAATGGGMRGRGLTGGRDPDDIRAENAAAPAVAHLWRRVGALFVPYRSQLALTAVLVLVTSAATVVPPLIVQRIFDHGLFPSDGAGGVAPPELGLLTKLVALMVAIFIASA